MKNNKKIIMIICGLFILLSGFAYINSDAIGKFVYKDDTKYVSSKNTGCISSSATCTGTSSPRWSRT